MSNLQYTIFRCQEYISSAVKLSQFLGERQYPHKSKHEQNTTKKPKTEKSSIDMQRLIDPPETFYIGKTFYPRGWLSSFLSWT